MNPQAKDEVKISDWILPAILPAIIFCISNAALAQPSSNQLNSEGGPTDFPATELNVGNYSFPEMSNEILGINAFKVYHDDRKIKSEKELRNQHEILQKTYFYGDLSALTNRIAIIQAAIDEAKRKELDQAFLDGEYTKVIILETEISLYQEELKIIRRQHFENPDSNDKTLGLEIDFLLVGREIKKLNDFIERYYTYSFELSVAMNQAGQNLETPREQVDPLLQEWLTVTGEMRKDILEAISVLKYKINNLEADSKDSPEFQRRAEESKFLYNMALAKAAQELNKRFFIETISAFKTLTTFQKIQHFTLNRLFPQSGKVDALIDSKMLLESFYFDFNFNEKTNIFLDADARVQEIARIFQVQQKQLPGSGVEEAFIYLSILQGKTFKSNATNPTLQEFYVQLEQVKNPELAPKAASKYELIQVQEKTYKAVLSCVYLFSM